jgi:hypothetical protein
MASKIIAAPQTVITKSGKKDITSITHFVPNRLYHLTKKKKEMFDGKLLKTSKLFDICNMVITKHYFKKDVLINLSSEILQTSYGTSYPKYMAFLIDQGVFSIHSKPCPGVKCTTYKLNTDIFKEGMKRFENTDKIVIKKWFKRLALHNSNTATVKSIPLWIKNKMITDLWSVEINYLAAHKELCDLYNTKEINDVKFYKNLESITAIANQELFYTEDNYGRFHTNFTILKKCFRTHHLTIDGQPITEVDITNSQPIFLALLLRDHGFDKQCPVEYERFYKLVKNGLVYEEIMDYANVSRQQAKDAFYAVVFGENKGDGKKMSLKWNKVFMALFPNVWQWVSDFKDTHADYRILARMLQKRESCVIYNDICAKVMTAIPTIKLFTVHDSLFFPVKYKEKVEKIFNERVSTLLD